MRQPLPENMRRLGRLRVRTWALIIWTVGAIATMIVARLSFAAPEPSMCRGDNSGLCFDFNLRPPWYLLIIILWLLGLGVILILAWSWGPARRERERQKLLNS